MSRRTIESAKHNTVEELPEEPTQKWNAVLRPGLSQLVKSAILSTSSYRLEATNAWYCYKGEEKKPCVIITVDDSRACKATTNALNEQQRLLEEASSCGLDIVVVVNPSAFDGFPHRRNPYFNLQYCPSGKHHGE
jgi:hypothetical protein